jgi:pimeloyl-ACP methyl ester carboxylesterase
LNKEFNMPIETIDGLEINYQVMGSGTPLLLFAPGGFDATIDKWREASAWTGMDALSAFAAEHRVIAYDRRECGRSGGQVEKLRWTSYTTQAAALLDHLKIDTAYVLGGCMGCSVALAFGVHHPERTRGLLLHWPVGGYRWKVSARARFQRHFDFAKEHGLAAVVERSRTGKSFWRDAEAGPWASVIERDRLFADAFVKQNLQRYLALISTTGRTMFDRDTATGAEPEEILGIDAPALIIPGDDPSHATSAAHYLRELLPKGEFWAVMPPEQNTQNVCARILEFCRAHA